jgi:hypothetical protein
VAEAEMNKCFRTDNSQKLWMAQNVLARRDAHLGTFIHPTEEAVSSFSIQHKLPTFDRTALNQARTALRKFAIYADVSPTLVSDNPVAAADKIILRMQENLARGRDLSD